MTITLQVGKRYVQRNGEVSPRMDHIHPTENVWMYDADGNSWRIDGGHWVSSCPIRDEDLISEYIELPAIDPLTGMPECQGVPLIETGPVFKVGLRFKVGDRVVPIPGITYPETWSQHSKLVGKVLIVDSITMRVYYDLLTGVATISAGGHCYKAEWLRPATAAEIAAADRPVERVTRKLWVNIYKDMAYVGETRKEADSVFTSRGRIACVCLDIDLEHGVGLQGQEFVVRVSKP